MIFTADITEIHFLVLGALVFTIGLAGVFINQKSVINLLMSIELMLLAVNINFVATSVYLGGIAGQIFSIFILAVAAAEVAIGLAILVVYFRNKGTIDIVKINQLRG